MIAMRTNLAGDFFHEMTGVRFSQVVALSDDHPESSGRARMDLEAESLHEYSAGGRRQVRSCRGEWKATDELLQQDSRRVAQTVDMQTINRARRTRGREGL